MCPNTELFLVRIFLHSHRIRRFTPQIHVFSANTGKYGPEITPYLDTFRAFLSVTASDERNDIRQGKIKQYPNKNIYKNDFILDFQELTPYFSKFSKCLQTNLFSCYRRIVQNNYFYNEIHWSSMVTTTATECYSCPQPLVIFRILDHRHQS